MSRLCDAILSSFEGQFRCEPLGAMVRIHTPFLYPDGDLVAIYATETPKGLTLSDRGEAAAWLRLQGFGRRRSDRQTRLIEQACELHGVEFRRGCLTMLVPDDAALADAVMMIGQNAILYQEDGLWIAHSVDFDYLGDGETREDALCELARAVQCGFRIASQQGDPESLRHPAEDWVQARFRAGGPDVVRGSIRILPHRGEDGFAANFLHAKRVLKEIFLEHGTPDPSAG